MSLGLWDYAVFALALFSSFMLGICHKFRRRNASQSEDVADYLLGSGQMGVIPVAFSLMASFMSAITLLGVARVSVTNGYTDRMMMTMEF